jgi:dipeptide/tripeptide permease
MGFFERIGFVGVSANLIMYLTGPLGMSTAAAAAGVNAWSGTVQVLPLVGALVADSRLGRYRALLAGCVLYLLVSLHSKKVVCIISHLGLSLPRLHEVALVDLIIFVFFQILK